MLQMTYLVDSQTTEAAWYIRGVTVPNTAWALLDKRYSNRRLDIDHDHQAPVNQP